MMADVLGKGWEFPVRLGPNGRFRLVGGDRKIRESIWLILSTAQGERVMRPRFGAGLPNRIFAPNDRRERASITQRVREALIRYEPRIDVLDVRAEVDGAVESQVLVYIDYRIRSNNAIHNLVYPFYMVEGSGV